MEAKKLETRPYAEVVAAMNDTDPVKVREVFKPLQEYTSVTMEIKKAGDTLKANVPMLAKLAFAFLASGLAKSAAYAGMGDTEALSAFLRLPDKKNGLNRIMPVRNAFRLVESGQLAEHVFDNLATDTLVALGEAVKLVNYDLQHPLVLDALAVIADNADKESKAKRVRALKERVKKDDKGVVNGYATDEELKAEAEKAKPTHANTLNAHEAADVLTKDHLDVFLAALVATAQTTSAQDVADKIIVACAKCGVHLSAKFGREKVNSVFAETVHATHKAQQEAQAAKDAKLAPGVKLVTAGVAA